MMAFPVGDWEREVGDWERAVGDWEREVGDWEREVGDWEREEKREDMANATLSASPIYASVCLRLFP
ncbi:hypothetical protein [Dolichospermum heterosporum]|uniref:Uncharacterized protein n=1 Tax=Dolichospermum heterosporum TAC447 TaxID=747523 RepID=A0ABY5LX85_9CYAN|nr:hypothetical protein [Dolichospermum heterosporum]UUO15486.1 hypothetical protein NG743_26465 [Dolichospermum heterosporum TAC447]